jgi:Zn-dependent protease
MLRLQSKIPITIYPLFFFMALLIGWVNSLSVYGTLVWFIVIFFSVLVHEYGHALTALGFGQKVQIDLVGLGGLTTRQGPRLKLWQEFLIVLNGPLAGFLLWGLSLQLLKMTKDPHTLWAQILTVSSQVNLFWTIVNLLPIQPLDGGHLLNILMEAIFGFRGIKIALFFSFMLAGLLSILCFMVYFVLPGALFLLMAVEGFRSWRVSLMLTEKDRDDSLQQLLDLARNNAIIGHKEEALAQLKILRNTAKGGLVYLSATQLMAKILKDQGHDVEALQLLLSIKKDLDAPSKLMLFQLGCKTKQWDIAQEVGTAVYYDFPTAENAILNAMSQAAQSKVQPALGWLQRAVQDGATNIQEIVTHPEFDPIRNNSLFQNWLLKIKK